MTRWTISLLAAVAALSLGLTGCAVETEAEAADEAVASSTQAMSRCGYPPRRVPGCVARCECSQPVDGPFGEDIGDYDCSGGRCVLTPRADCAFELYCE